MQESDGLADRNQRQILVLPDDLEQTQVASILADLGLSRNLHPIGQLSLNLV